MHLVIPTHVYFFWMRCHPNRTTLPKEVEWEPQNKLPLLPTTWPHPLIPLTCGSPLLYWLRTGRWCLSLMCTPLPSKSIAFLALTCLPLPLGLSNSTVRSNICLILATWMIHGSLSFVLYIPSLFRTGHCLGVGSLPFTWPMFLFVLRLWAIGAPAMPLHCFCYDITYPFTYFYLWAYRLKRLPCPFLILFLLLDFFAKHSCWASSFRALGISDPFYSLSILSPFYSSLPLSHPWVFC